MNAETIDFVVPWVDSNDPEWIKTYNHYRPDKPISDNARFRNWDIFRYWFRAVESYAPWVNKVYLVTNGKFPDWINPECEKLVLVKHSDYIPEKYLPTFNSKTIELNLGRLKYLSEHFVYFNDDIFINAPVTPEYFFKDGLPCDYNFESIYRNPSYTKDNHFGVDLDMFCDVAVINNHFNRKQVIRQAWKKWYGPHLWGKPLFFSLLMLSRTKFENFPLWHHEQPMLKSIFHEIWEKEADILDQSCSQFRKEASLNQYIIRYWQFASNKFYPVKKKGLAYHYYSKGIVADLINNLYEEKYQSICINDSPYCSETDYEYAKREIKIAFEKKFPRISMFEKNE
jgi:hypothetical protein